MRRPLGYGVQQPAGGRPAEFAFLGHPGALAAQRAAGEHEQPAGPGTAIDNAYTRIVQVGEAPFSGANNYAYLLN